MLFNRAVITGYGVITPVGGSVGEMMQALEAGKCATRSMSNGWNRYGQLRCQVGAPIDNRDASSIPRVQRRTMSPMSFFAVQAAKQALQQAGIDPASIPANPRFGCIMGSTTGRPRRCLGRPAILCSGRWR